MACILPWDVPFWLHLSETLTSLWVHWTEGLFTSLRVLCAAQARENQEARVVSEMQRPEPAGVHPVASRTHHRDLGSKDHVGKRAGKATSELKGQAGHLRKASILQ